MTADQLEKLAKAATGGRWWTGVYVGAPYPAKLHHVFQDEIGNAIEDIIPEDAALIAAMCSEPARNRIIAALRLVERIEAGDVELRDATGLSVRQCSVLAKELGDESSQLAR
jgi:hypothetical protein